MSLSACEGFLVVSSQSSRARDRGRATKRLEPRPTTRGGSDDVACAASDGLGQQLMQSLVRAHADRQLGMVIRSCSLLALRSESCDITCIRLVPDETIQRVGTEYKVELKILELPRDGGFQLSVYKSEGATDQEALTHQLILPRHVRQDPHPVSLVLADLELGYHRHRLRIVLRDLQASIFKQQGAILFSVDS